MRSYEEVLQENCELRRVVAAQQEQIAAQQEQIAELQQRIEQLEKLAERLQRAGKRQAAPFSKGPPKSNPKRPGRKPGKDYGRQALPQRPERVAETITVPCPLYCEHCHGRVKLTDKGRQYQIDVPPVQPHVREFIVDYGHCERCGRRAQGRHRLQVSDALGVGDVHFGPGVISLAVYLNKSGGLSWEKIAELFEQWFGLRVSRSGLCRAAQRLSDQAEPTYQGLMETIRGSPMVTGDETGWRLGGLSAWLWTFTNGIVTVYNIARGRGFAEASSVLGEDYDGKLVADGWAVYRLFEQAVLQTCLAHLLRRCSQMIERARGGAVHFPRKVAAILRKALELRDRRDRGELSEHGLRVATGRLKKRLGRLLRGRLTDPDNRRLAKHLLRYEEALFVFLEHDDVPATNWLAEHALRGAVVNRKVSGGNRSNAGARTQAVLTSVLRTCHQQHINPFEVLTDLLRAPQPQPHPSLVATG